MSQICRSVKCECSWDMGHKFLIQTFLKCPYEHLSQTDTRHLCILYMCVHIYMDLTHLNNIYGNAIHAISSTSSRMISKLSTYHA